MRYRPWGAIEWVLSLSAPKAWHWVGAIGTEQRSLTGWREARRLGAVASEDFVEIQDVPSIRHQERTSAALNERREEFESNGGLRSSIVSFDLLSELFRMTEFAQGTAGKGQSLVLDITSLPKRFFFTLLRTFAIAPNVKNLLVTYTSPASYADDAPLYEDILPWKPLPGFWGSGSKPEQWVVSVGFLVESLRQYVGDNPQEQVTLLIPFPAPLAVMRRTWKSVSDLEQAYEDGRFKEGRFAKHRVDTIDMSAAFDRIRSLAGASRRELAFAPFGPKPTSAAMCLYAMQRDSAVHYPQPTVYHPDYSLGIRGGDALTATSAYWVKHDGELLYEA